METLVAMLILAEAATMHELGHAVMALLTGMRIEKVFLGVPIWPKWKLPFKMPEVTISLWPLFAGLVINEESYWSAHPAKRFAVSAAGPLANLALGIFVAFRAFDSATGSAVSLEMILAAFAAPWMLIRGQVPPSAISGPVEVVRYTAQAISTDFQLGPVFSRLLVNFGLAGTNLLPIPALDGGFMLLGATSALIFRNKPESILAAKEVSLWALRVLVTLLAFKVASELAALTPLCERIIPGVC